MQTSLMRPVPAGGRTFFDFTRPGLAASSSSVIQRVKTGWSARDQFHQPRRHVLLGEAGFGNVEIDAAIVLARPPRR